MFWVLQLLAFFAKVTVLWLLQFVVRWALPRFRYDQLMRLGWRIMLPLSLVNIGVTAVALIAADGEANYVMATGLAVLTLFVLSLFYRRTPREAETGHGHGHDDHSHDDHGHGHAEEHAVAAHH